jgi:hypothetical protein
MAKEWAEKLCGVGASKTCEELVQTKLRLFDTVYKAVVKTVTEK